jgi:hypothetical protein
MQFIFCNERSETTPVLCDFVRLDGSDAIDIISIYVKESPCV